MAADATARSPAPPGCRGRASATTSHPSARHCCSDQVAELTGGDRNRPIVVFCKPDCWASWNVGKRLIRAGYTGVAWFPGGVDAWQVDHPTAPVEALPGWDATPGEPARSG